MPESEISNPVPIEVKCAVLAIGLNRLLVSVFGLIGIAKFIFAEMHDWIIWIPYATIAGIGLVLILIWTVLLMGLWGGKKWAWYIVLGMTLISVLNLVYFSSGIGSYTVALLWFSGIYLLMMQNSRRYFFGQPGL